MPRGAAGSGTRRPRRRRRPRRKARLARAEVLDGDARDARALAVAVALDPTHEGEVAQLEALGERVPCLDERAEDDVGARPAHRAVWLLVARDGQGAWTEPVRQLGGELLGQERADGLADPGVGEGRRLHVEQLEMPEPRGLRRGASASMPQSARQASACTANASLSSMTSRSSSPRPARDRVSTVAGTGATPKSRGLLPATAHETSRTDGVSPSAAARGGVVTMQAAAASFCPLELPAVTVDAGSFFPRIGRRRVSASSEESARGCSSRSMTTSPFRPGTVTGMSSASNAPDSWAATARWCDCRAKRSCASREMPYSERSSSALPTLPSGLG